MNNQIKVIEEKGSWMKNKAYNLFFCPLKIDIERDYYPKHEDYLDDMNELLK